MTSLTNAYGGVGVDLATCEADPANVPLSADGYAQVIRAKSPDSLAIFITRLLHHMGGAVADQRGLLSFAADFIADSSMTPREALSVILSDLTKILDNSGKPQWAIPDKYAACVADRNVDAETVGDAISIACGLLGDIFNCNDVPVGCNTDGDDTDDRIYSRADYVLSFYYGVMGGTDALMGCNFSGAAMFAPWSVYNAQDSTCVVSNEPTTTPLTEEGYVRIINVSAQGEPVDPDDVREFILRVIAAAYEATVQLDQGQLQALSLNPPQHYHDLLGILANATWICGGLTKRDCPVHGGFFLVICLVGLLVSGFGVWAVMRNQNRRANEELLASMRAQGNRSWESEMPESYPMAACRSYPIAAAC